MANTYVALAKATPSGVTSLTISSIPQTYTDLLITISARTNLSAWVDAFENRINGTTGTTYTGRILAQNNSGTATNIYSSTESVNTFYGGDLPAASTTSVFSNTEFYIPNYTGSQQKVISMTTTSEANAAFRGSIQCRAVLWSATTAVSSLYIVANGQFQSGSEIHVYGIKNS